MAVLNTTSPATGASYPKDLPWNWVPSLKTKVTFFISDIISLFHTNKNKRILHSSFFSFSFLSTFVVGTWSVLV